MLERFEAFTKNVAAADKFVKKIKGAEMRRFGIQGSCVMCLFYLSNAEEGLTPIELRELCDEDKAAISRNLASLHEKNFIMVDEKKKYRALIRLTEKGEEMAKRLDGLIETWVEVVGKGLSEQDRAAFYRGLDIISNNLREGAENLMTTKGE